MLLQGRLAPGNGGVETLHAEPRIVGEVVANTTQRLHQISNHLEQLRLINPSFLTFEGFLGLRLEAHGHPPQAAYVFCPPTQSCPSQTPTRQPAAATAQDSERPLHTRVSCETPPYA